MANLHVVNVMHGNASVLVDSNGVTIIDVGLKQRLLQYLIKHGITDINAIVISHADVDHSGGLIDLLLSNNIVIKTIYINSDPLQNSLTWKAVKIALNEAANSKGVRVTNIHTGTSSEFHSGMIDIEISAPDTETVLTGIPGTDKNGKSINKHSLNVVVRLKNGERNLVLLPGDINNDGLELIRDDSNSIEADVLIFPHHGGNPGSKDPIEFTDIICNMVKPRIIVFSIGDLHKNHPRPEILQRILELDGDCVILSTGEALTLSDIIEENPDCQHKNKLGNIIFNIDVDPIKYYSI